MFYYVINTILSIPIQLVFELYDATHIHRYYRNRNKSCFKTFESATKSNFKKNENARHKYKSNVNIRWNIVLQRESISILFFYYYKFIFNYRHSLLLLYVQNSFLFFICCFIKILFRFSILPLLNRNSNFSVTLRFHLSIDERSLI